MHKQLHLKVSFPSWLALVSLLLIGSALGTNDFSKDHEFDATTPIVSEFENASQVHDDDSEDRQLAAPISSEKCSSANLTVKKTAPKNLTADGEEIEFIIEVKNVGDVAVHNVEVRDVFRIDGDQGNVELVSADPDPVTGYTWHFDSLASGKSLNISYVVKVPSGKELEFGMEEGVSGSGFVKVDNDYSSTFDPYIIKNFVYVSSDETPTISNCAGVTVVAGLYADLATYEHGSGRYESEELISLKSENSSIKMDKDASSTFETTSIGLYNNRTLNFSSRWTGEACAKNRVTGVSMSESYRHAASINRESRMKLDVNGSVMEIDSEFEGMSHIGFLKTSPSLDAIRSSQNFESKEDYVGSFRVRERIDEYDCHGEYLSINDFYSVDSDKSVSGSGFASEDKKVRDSQRTYEYGTGTYESEETIRTSTNYIAKDLSLVYAPVNLSLTDNFILNQSTAWKEGIYSRNRGLSLIGEEYTDVTQLDKETAARGLSEMETEANFSGVARYRSVVENLAEVDEVYEGEYSLGMSILVKGIPKYDRPHMNISKRATVYHLPESTYAKYAITVENDGNRALGPIYVRDVFPLKSEFVGSSLRSTDLTESSAKWILMNLGIGDLITITLCLNVSDNHCPELVSFAEASGGLNNGEEWIMANCTSSVEMDLSMSDPADSFSVTDAEALRDCSESGDVCEIPCKIPCDNMMLDLYSFT